MGRFFDTEAARRKPLSGFRKPASLSDDVATLATSATPASAMSQMSRMSQRSTAEELEDLWFAFEEWAAVLEYDGELPRKEAERRAAAELGLHPAELLRCSRKYARND